MKEGIHPQYKEVTIRCACGETVKTRSTKGDANGELRVDICSKCHPFFTGKQKFVDAGGRVDKFKKRLELSGGILQGFGFVVLPDFYVILRMNVSF